MKALAIDLDGVLGNTHGLWEAWLDDAGDTTAVSVYREEALGWTLEREEALPRGVSRAVLVSLGP
jgi:hypothetical protein